MMVSNGKQTFWALGYTKLFQRFNPLSPHVALKHHFATLKIHLIFLQQSVLDRKFP